MTTQEKIRIMQAWVDGKAVEFNDYGNWKLMEHGPGEPVWNWDFSYRIKPTTREIHLWTHPEHLLPLREDIAPNPQGQWEKKLYREVI